MAGVTRSVLWTRQKLKKANHGAKVLPLFAEGVSEPRHAAHSHADRKILSFDVRRANARHIGLAVDRSFDRGRHFWWSVARFAFAVGLVDLYDGCEVSARA
jgi:hypothetical protein